MYSIFERNGTYYIKRDGVELIYVAFSNGKAAAIYILRHLLRTQPAFN
jgi:hypothetical protein